jgi:hypothetical protein
MPHYLRLEKSGDRIALLYAAYQAEPNAGKRKTLLRNISRSLKRMEKVLNAE